MSRSAALFPPRDVEHSDADHCNRLAEALFPLVLKQAKILAIGGSLLNRWNGAGLVNAPLQLRHFLPEALPPIRLALLGGAFDSRSIVEGIDEFSAHLDFIRRFALSILDGDPTASEKDVEFAAIKDLWRGLAVSAQLLLIQLTGLMRDRSREAVSHATSSTLELLKDVSEGRSPCTESNGDIKFEELLNRRRSPRLPIDMPVEIVTDMGRQTCRISDVSAGGVGLKGVSGLSTGENVTLMISSGRELHGVVAWCKGPNAGIRLTGERTAANPLIAWAASWQNDP